MKGLVIKTSALGDVVQAMEALACLNLWRHDLHEANSSFELAPFELDPFEFDWVVEKPASSLLQIHPDVKQLHVMDTKNWRCHIMKHSTWSQIAEFRSQLRKSPYHVAVDLQGNVKSAFCMWTAIAAKKVGFSRSVASEWPASFGLDVAITPDPSHGARGVYIQLLAAGLGLSLTSSDIMKILGKSSELHQYPWRFDKSVISQVAPLISESQYGLMAMGSRWFNKQISAELAIEILQHILPMRPHEKIYLVWGSSEEQQEAEKVAKNLNHPRVTVLPKGNLQVLVRSIQQAKWIISADSLALHIGSCMGTPSFGAFGPSSGEFYGAQGLRHGFWQGGCPYGLVFQKRCDRLRTCSTGACLHQISAKPLLQVLDTWLREINL